jgi:hypothetical protein
MNVTEFDTAPYVPSYGGPGDVHLPEGLHVSRIISDMLQTIDPKRYEKDKPLPAVKLTGGVAFERELEKILTKSIPGGFRPDPIQVDGIWMSPDNVATDPWRVREFKLSWYSLKTKPCPFHDVYWPWRTQIMAYLKGIEGNIGELWGYFVNGDYPVGAPSPQLKGFVIDFSDQEIEENWGMLVNHAKHRGWL